MHTYIKMTTYHIYKIKSQQTDKIYIGSTLKELTERLKHHEYYYKSWINYNNLPYTSPYEILKFNDHVIEVIETRTYIDELERNKRERHYIELYKLICVNKQIKDTTKENKEYQKQYRQDNKEKIKQYQKQHRQLRQ